MMNDRFDIPVARRQFDALMAQHPDHADQIHQARNTFVEWAMGSTIMIPKKLVSNVEHHAKGQMFCGNAEALAALGLVENATRGTYLTAHVLGREGLSPSEAEVLGLEILDVAQAKGVSAPFDSWRLMSTGSLGEKIGVEYLPAISTAMGDPCLEPNLRAVLETGAGTELDLRPQCVLRLETISVESPSWLVLESGPVLVPEALQQAALIRSYPYGRREVEVAGERVLMERRTQAEKAAAMAAQSFSSASMRDMVQQDMSVFQRDLMQQFRQVGYGLGAGVAQQPQPQPPMPPPLRPGLQLHQAIADNPEFAEQLRKDPGFFKRLLGSI